MRYCECCAEKGLQIHFCRLLQYFQSFVFAKVGYVPVFHEIEFTMNYITKDVPDLIGDSVKEDVNIFFNNYLLDKTEKRMQRRSSLVTLLSPQKVLNR